MPRFDHLPEVAFETGRGVIFPWLCDTMGHLATQHYMGFFDSAFFHLLAAIAPTPTADADHGLGWADVRHEIDYRAELRNGDLVVLHSAIARLGRTSLSHRTYMTRTTDGRLCCSLLSKTVRFDLGLRKAAVIEGGVRAQAERLLILP